MFKICFEVGKNLLEVGLFLVLVLLILLFLMMAAVYIIRM